MSDSSALNEKAQLFVFMLVAVQAAKQSGAFFCFISTMLMVKSNVFLLMMCWASVKQKLNELSFRFLSSRARLDPANPGEQETVHILYIHMYRIGYDDMRKTH